MLRIFASVVALAMAMPAVAAGNADAGRSKSQVCAGCHGVDGNAAIPNYPKLAGQHASYLVKQLSDFKAGKRKDPIMSAQVVNLQPQDMEDIAAYFNSQSVKIGAASDKAKRELGERIYRGGNETKGVAACMACHGPNGAGNPPAKFPALSGQNADYVSKTMRDLRDGNRGFDDKDDAGKTMRIIAKKMSDAEIDAVAHYISGLH
jgi:cytochrome c553